MDDGLYYENFNSELAGADMRLCEVTDSQVDKAKGRKKREKVSLNPPPTKTSTQLTFAFSKGSLERKNVFGMVVMKDSLHNRHWNCIKHI